MPTTTTPMEIPTTPPPAPAPEEHVQQHSPSWPPHRLLRCCCELESHPSYADPSNRKNEHSRSTCSVPAERGRWIDRYCANHHCTENTRTQEWHLLDDGIVGVGRRLHCVTCRDRYIIVVRTVTVKTVTYLGFEYQSVNDGDGRRFTVELAAKYVDEYLDTVQLPEVMEQKELWIHTMRRQRKIKCNILRTELLLENCNTILQRDRTWCLRQHTYDTNLRHQHLQIGHASRKCWNWKRTRELNLHLGYLQWNRTTWTKPWNTSRNILMLTGLVTHWRRKAHLAPLCYVDQFLLTSECRRQKTAALSNGESEMYALGALSAELILA